MSVSTATPPGLRERNKVKRRSALIRAAAELFSERGYAETTIADIAEAAEVAPRTVSLYFASKLDIALAPTVDALERLKCALHRSNESDSVIDVICDWLSEEISPFAESDLRLAHRMAERNPDLVPLSMSRINSVREEIAGAIAMRFDVPAGDNRLKIIEAALSGVITYIYSQAESTEWEDQILLARRFLNAGLHELMHPGARN